MQQSSSIIYKSYILNSAPLDCDEIHCVMLMEWLEMTQQYRFKKNKFMRSGLSVINLGQLKCSYLVKMGASFPKKSVSRIL